MTLVIISGGIDLSVGALLALVSVTIGFSYDAGFPMWASMFLGMLAGILGGAFNGVIQCTIIVFMFLAASNLSLLYYFASMH